MGTWPRMRAPRPGLRAFYRQQRRTCNCRTPRAQHTAPQRELGPLCIAAPPARNPSGMSASAAFSRRFTALHGASRRRYHQADSGGQLVPQLVRCGAAASPAQGLRCAAPLRRSADTGLFAPWLALRGGVGGGDGAKGASDGGSGAGCRGSIALVTAVFCWAEGAERPPYTERARRRGHRAASANTTPPSAALHLVGCRGSAGPAPYRPPSRTPAQATRCRCRAWRLPLPCTSPAAAPQGGNGKRRTARRGIPPCGWWGADNPSGGSGRGLTTPPRRWAAMPFLPRF